MPDRKPLVRSNGERLKVILPPDADIGTSLHTSSQGRQWWTRRVHLRTPLLVAVFAICFTGSWIIADGIIQVDSRVDRQFFSATPNPEASLFSMIASYGAPILVAFTPGTHTPATPIAAALMAADGTQEVQLLSPNQGVNVARPCEPSDLESMTIAFAAPVSIPETTVARTTNLPFLMDERVSDICYLPSESNDTTITHWGDEPNSVILGEANGVGQSSTGRIVMLSADGSSIHRHLLYQTPRQLSSFDISSTSGEIVCSASSTVYLCTDPGSRFGIYMGTDPVWSPDGTKVVFLSNRYPGTIGDSPWLSFLTSAMDGSWYSQNYLRSRVRSVTPAWDPNGSSLAYLGANGELWAIDTSSRQRSQITVADLDIYAIDWLPDGSGIAFAARVDGQPGAIFITDLQGNIRQVTPRIMGLASFDWR